MTISVVAAFLASGGLNAGTPLLIASVPVSATDPKANARRMRTAETAANPSTGGVMGGGVKLAAGSPLAIRRDAEPDEHERARRRTCTWARRRCCPTPGGHGGSPP